LASSLVVGSSVGVFVGAFVGANVGVLETSDRRFNRGVLVGPFVGLKFGALVAEATEHWSEHW
jgi:uncharacterized protein YqgC (DUF456 family)